MTVDQAVKKFKLEPLNVYTAKAKAKELNVEEVLYMNVQKNKYAYIVKDGARGYVLYQDEKSIYSKMYKGLKMTPLEPYTKRNPELRCKSRFRIFGYSLYLFL